MRLTSFKFRMAHRAYYVDVNDLPQIQHYLKKNGNFYLYI